MGGLHPFGYRASLPGPCRSPDPQGSTAYNANVTQGEVKLTGRHETKEFFSSRPRELFSMRSALFGCVTKRPKLHAFFRARAPTGLCADGIPAPNRNRNSFVNEESKNPQPLHQPTYSVWRRAN